MGGYVEEGIPMLIAEELDVNLKQVRLEPLPRQHIDYRQWRARCGVVVSSPLQSKI